MVENGQKWSKMPKTDTYQERKSKMVRIGRKLVKVFDEKPKKSDQEKPEKLLQIFHFFRLFSFQQFDLRVDFLVTVLVVS